MTHFLRSMWSPSVDLIWWNRMSASFFPFLPQTPNKKNEASFSKHRRVEIFHAPRDWHFEKRNISELKRKWGNQGATRGRWCRGDQPERSKDGILLFWLEIEKKFVKRRKVFLRSEHSKGVTNPSAPQLTWYARQAAPYHAGNAGKKINKTTHCWLFELSLSLSTVSKQSARTDLWPPTDTDKASTQLFCLFRDHPVWSLAMEVMRWQSQWMSRL